MTTVRVLSYNIRSLRDDRAALTRVIQGCEPDLVCLQEVPRFLRWRAKRQALARDCGLAVAAGRRTAGLAVLAGPRVRPIASEHHLLTRVPRLHRRGLAIAVVEIDGSRLIAAGTHLDLESGARRAHVGEVLALLERARRAYQAPVVLTGDINEQPGGEAWELLARALPDAYLTAPRGAELTFSARNPRKRIDGVFADRGLGVLGCGVPEDAVLAADYPSATDHRPVLTELTVP